MLNKIWRKFPRVNWETHREETKRSFWRGYRCGEREGFELANERNRIQFMGLSGDEKEEVLKYLEENGFQFGYMAELGGFYILKK